MTMKLCKDCKYFKPDDDKDLCVRETNGEDLVRGKYKKKEYVVALPERSRSGGVCGKEGKRFEYKWYLKWKGWL